MKFKISILFSVIAIFSIIAGKSLSFFTTEAIAKNVITAGNIDLKIHEKTINGEDASFEINEVMPGDIIDRIVTVENMGDHPLYLRIKLFNNTSKENNDENILVTNINTENWTYKNGYYYYNNILKAKEFTPALFTKIYVNGENMDNSYIGKKITLNISAYAVQSENNGADVWTAYGWPTD